MSITARTPIPNAQTRDVVVSPGAADGLEILRHLDAPGALGELADLVLASPGSAAVSSVELRGERFAVAGAVGELGATTEAMTEIGRSEAIWYADLTPEALTLFLVDDPAEADVRALARAVDASGLASSRTVTPDGDVDAVAWFDAELSTL